MAVEHPDLRRGLRRLTFADLVRCICTGCSAASRPWCASATYEAGGRVGASTRATHTWRPSARRRRSTDLAHPANDTRPPPAWRAQPLLQVARELREATPAERQRLSRASLGRHRARALICAHPVAAQSSWPWSWASKENTHGTSSLAGAVECEQALRDHGAEGVPLAIACLTSLSHSHPSPVRRTTE